MLFTDRYVKSLKPTGSGESDKREGNGFGIRVHPSGVKTFFFIYRIDGKRRFMNLGHYPAVSLETARIKYNDAYKIFKNGGDPANLANLEREGRRKAPTVADLILEYMEKHAKPNKKSWPEDERCLNKEVLPAWGKRKAADICKRDVILLLEAIVERGARVQSNNTFEKIRKMFNFACERDILQASPCSGIKPLTEKVARDRYLAEHEIKTLWASLDSKSISMSLKLRRTLKLILVTAQRPGEVVGIHRREIEGHWWTIPAQRSKNKKAHRVFLTEMALELVGDAEGYIFESPKKGKAIDVNALATAVRRNILGESIGKKCKRAKSAPVKVETQKIVNKMGVDFFRPHDLRRTASSHMAALHVPEEWRERILNHVKKKLDGTYNLYEYDGEKKVALERWERKLKSIISVKQECIVVNIKDRRKSTLATIGL